MSDLNPPPGQKRNNFMNLSYDNIEPSPPLSPAGGDGIEPGMVVPPAAALEVGDAGAAAPPPELGMIPPPAAAYDKNGLVNTQANAEQQQQQQQQQQQFLQPPLEIPQPTVADVQGTLDQALVSQITDLRRDNSTLTAQLRKITQESTQVKEEVVFYKEAAMQGSGASALPEKMAIKQRHLEQDNGLWKKKCAQYTRRVSELEAEVLELKQLQKAADSATSMGVGGDPSNKNNLSTTDSNRSASATTNVKDLLYSGMKYDIPGMLKGENYKTFMATTQTQQQQQAQSTRSAGIAAGSGSVGLFTTNTNVNNLHDDAQHLRDIPEYSCPKQSLKIDTYERALATEQQKWNQLRQNDLDTIQQLTDELNHLREHAERLGTENNRLEHRNDQLTDAVAALHHGGGGLGGVGGSSSTPFDVAGFGESSFTNNSVSRLTRTAQQIYRKHDNPRGLGGGGGSSSGGGDGGRKKVDLLLDHQDRSSVYRSIFNDNNNRTQPQQQLSSSSSTYPNARGTAADQTDTMFSSSLTNISSYAPSYGGNGTGTGAGGGGGGLGRVDYQRNRAAFSPLGGAGSTGSGPGGPPIFGGLSTTTNNGRNGVGRGDGGGGGFMDGTLANVSRIDPVGDPQNPGDGDPTATGFLTTSSGSSSRNNRTFGGGTATAKRPVI